MNTPAPTSRDRFAALDPDARARWLDPAEAEFCTHGFADASMNRILAAAGESKGRTYHYFADKAELFRATLERRMQPLGDLSPATTAAATQEPGVFWETLGALCERLTGILQADLRLAALLRTVHREPLARDALGEPLARLQGEVATLLTHGQSIGAVRLDLPLSLLTEVALDLLASVDRWFALNAPDLPEAEEADLSRRAFTLLMAPFLPPTQSEVSFQ